MSREGHEKHCMKVAIITLSLENPVNSQRTLSLEQIIRFIEENCFVFGRNPFKEPAPRSHSSQHAAPLSESGEGGGGASDCQFPYLWRFLFSRSVLLCKVRVKPI